jgi:hypothetical protein
MLLIRQGTIPIIFLPLLMVVVVVVVLHGVDEEGHELLRVQGHLGGHNHLPAVSESVVRHLAHGTLYSMHRLVREVDKLVGG